MRLKNRKNKYNFKMPPNSEHSFIKKIKTIHFCIRTNENSIYLIVLFISCVNIVQPLNAIRIKDSAYTDLIIDIREAVPASMCREVLDNLEVTLKGASEYLFKSLDGRAYFGGVIVNLPETWPDSCVLSNSSTTSNQLTGVSQGGRSSITITNTNLLYGDKIWTQQSGGCGVEGDQIYIPYRSLEGKNTGKELVKEWAKYRYGIFDEIGFYDDKIYPQCYFTDSLRVTGCSDGSIKDVRLCMKPNPYADMVKTLNKTSRTSLMYVSQGEGVTMFCDEGTHDRYAPTKHNLLCDRRSTLEVILRHQDFAPWKSATVNSNAITHTTPIIQYMRRTTTRYVVVIDETQEILVRESWSFLRNALRKWVVYDLDPSCEVGIVLASTTATNKILRITKLDVQKNRDLVASFVPYAPSDSRQTACIGCALRTSLEILEDRRKNQGNASHVIVILAPGMDFNTDYNELANDCIARSARIVTINFPSLARRQPLDKLGLLTGGMSFTIHEKKYNSEKSYLDTYFELSDALFHISQEYHEGPAYKTTIEVHRKSLVDISSDFTTQSKRASRIVQGTFFIDGKMGNPSGFFIYTHNVETPLIQNVRVTSPSGVVYNTRSDQRLPVRQLTLLANINETGAWVYMIERFSGNPQPHFVQVMATPVSEDVNTVRARSWIRALQAGGPFIVYCEVKRGDYPVLSAFVQVQITRPDITCNYTICKESFKLFDTGSGDPDIVKDDGIYSRYVRINTGPGMYKFEILVDDNSNTAYSLQDNALIQNIPCCGSSISTKQTRQTAPFQRYLPPYTLHLIREDINSLIYIPVGRIGDLIVTYLDEGKVRLTWTTPDMGGESVARYEIKFAFTMEDIVDRYDTAAIMWNHDTPYPYDVADICSFILDINLEPRLFGEAVFFAIRPYAKLATNAIGGPISNVVRTYIPKTFEQTSSSPIHPSTSEFQPEESFSFRNDNVQNDTTIRNEIDMKVMYSISVMAGTLCVLLLIAIYYFVCHFRRGKERKIKIARQNPNKEEAKNSPAGSPLHPSVNELSSIHATTATTIVHNYATLDTPDHHIVGIPIYKNHDVSEKKRLSTSGSFNGITQITSHDYLIDGRPSSEMINNIRPLPGYYTANCSIGGLSIISANSENATLPRPGGGGESRPILSPYESWTASQLLHEHERRTSPLDEMMNQVNLKHNNINSANQISNRIDSLSLNGNGNGGPPPVPPLPYAPDIYQHYKHPYMYGTIPRQQQHHNSMANTTYCTVIHPSNEQKQQSSMSFNNQQPLLPNNAIGAGISNGKTNPAVDKKRRNVTMV
ncbi:calcium-activated chloride channel regulator 4-like isoform X2 [Eupeodes corollae]|uniref:calcium-activated chloride channel regulator 4-like isoform X2 n=1 Tax=Eupeodes corollae TaxID=290404 RepID=UPI002491418E|nr:calcium-activated chloride channel regulator 4-like isoform X2 [Eupeodes corollae]